MIDDIIMTLKYKQLTQNHRSHTLQKQKDHPITVFVLVAVDDVFFSLLYLLSVEASAEP